MDQARGEAGTAISDRQGRGAAQLRRRDHGNRSKLAQGLAALLLVAAAYGGAVPGAAAGPLARAGVLAGATVLQIPVLPAPAGLTATALTATEVQLTWAGTSETGSFFTIWRKRLPGAGDFARIALVPASQTGYTDQTVDPESQYVYRVRAETNDSRSDWSNETAVTTPAPPAGVAVRVVVPAEAVAPDTPVMLSYSLPDGDRLDENPFIVVIDPSGALFELHPAYLDQPSPNGQGHRDLPTELYPAGTYQVRAQLSLVDASGRPGGAASPWMPLTVPPAAVASLTVGPTITAGQTAPATVRLSGGSRNQPAVVALSSSDPAAAAVPPSVSIPTSSVVATFAVTAGAVTAPTPVTITAAYNGSSMSAPLTVLPAAPVAR